MSSSSASRTLVRTTVTTRRIPIFALALFEVHGPGSKEFPEKEQFALAILKGLREGKQYEWWVEDIRFPYKPRTYVAPTKAPDDGHGHAH